MIKEQCYKCRKNGTSDCSKKIVFDGASCELYSRAIDLTKKDDVQTNTIQSDTDICAINNQESTNPPSYTAEQLRNETEIGGWLSFFLFSLVAGGTLSLIIPLVQYSKSAVEYGSSALALVDVVFGGVLCILALYTLVSFIRRSPNAVFLAKLYVVLAFSSNLLVLFGGDYESSGLGSLPQIIKSLIWGVVWFLYLCFSDRVEETIPPAYRKLTSSDYYIAIGSVLVPVLFLAIGIGSIVQSRSEEETAFIQRIELKDNEYTDGKVVFSKPLGFTCDQQSVDVGASSKLTVFSLECENVGNITICSDYETDNSQSKFSEYCSGWQDENASGLSSSIVSFEKRRVNGMEYWYKVTRYDTETPVFWRFSLLFDNSSNKVCLISAYDNGYDSYYSEILKSIRF